jgi:hypothetical protein
MPRTAPAYDRSVLLSSSLRSLTNFAAGNVELKTYLKDAVHCANQTLRIARWFAICAHQAHVHMKRWFTLRQTQNQF